MLVPSEGPRDARIAIIGEAPGEQEEHQGRPFVGPSGYFLDKLLARVSIHRPHCYVGNVCQARPPYNKFSAFAPEYVASETERLLGELREVRPNITIALGGHALYALTGMGPIGKWRGSLLRGKAALPTWPAKTIGSWHPSYVTHKSARYEQDCPTLEMDLSRALEQSTTPDLSLPPRTTTVLRTPEAFERWCVGQFLTTGSEPLPLSVDIETIGQRLTCIGFATSAHAAVVVPFYDQGESAMGLNDEARMIRLIKRLLESRRVALIGQNFQFDLTHLARHYGIHPQRVFIDTMCLHNVVYAELPKALAYLTSIYTLQPYYKAARGSSGDALWRYNGLDCMCTYECAQELIKEAKDFGVWEFYQLQIAPLVIPLINIQNYGMRVDLECRERMKREMTIKRDTARDSIRTLADDPKFNPNSTAQMKDLLYTKLRFSPRYKRGTKDLTTDAAALAMLTRHYNHPILVQVSAYRKYAKLVSTYLNTKLDPDGRCRTQFSPYATETGRLSSSKTIDDTGANMQNQPRHSLFIRAQYVPEPGHVLLEADLRQAEARYVAYAAQCRAMIECFERNGDVHNENAARLLGIDIGAVTPAQRYLAKRLVHAFDYGLGKNKAAEIINKDFPELAFKPSDAEVLKESYFAAYPEILQWHDSVREIVKETRLLATPLGRKRMFFGRLDDSLYREAIGFCPQSTIGDLLNRALPGVFYALQPPARIVNQVHDALVLTLPIAMVDATVALITRALNIPITLHDVTFTIPIEFKVGPNWCDMHELN